MRTPIQTSRRVGIPHLPTGKTPLNNSTIKTRTQTTKRINMDATPSTILTPVKQRVLLNKLLIQQKILQHIV